MGAPLEGGARWLGHPTFYGSLVPGNLPWKCYHETWRKALGSCFMPPDLMVFRLSKWNSSNPEGHFALKIHLICPETQFSQTQGGGKRLPPPDPLGNTPMSWAILGIHTAVRNMEVPTILPKKFFVYFPTMIIQIGYFSSLLWMDIVCLCLPMMYM